MSAIHIRNNGEEWCGTFQATAAFLISDILSDGAPIRSACVGYMDEDDNHQLARGSIIELHREQDMASGKHDKIVFANGTRVPLFAVVTVDIH